MREVLASASEALKAGRSRSSMLPPRGCAASTRRSSAEPVAEVTRASEAMAHGQYDQQIPVEGRDEIGRLAASFNAMAYQVSRSHRMMRDLLANVAHELKTPLTSIQGFSQALVDGNARTPDDQTQ